MKFLYNKKWDEFQKETPSESIALDGYVVGGPIFDFVSAKELNNKRYGYSIGKISEFIPFPVQELYDILNKAEGIDIQNTNRRNGGTTIGGSPREGGSKLSPQEVIQIINDHINKKRR